VSEEGIPAECETEPENGETDRVEKYMTSNKREGKGKESTERIAILRTAASRTNHSGKMKPTPTAAKTEEGGRGKGKDLRGAC